MQEKHLFEYAVIRVVPQVEREEFINVGIILICAKQNFIKTRFELNPHRLTALSGQVDIAELNAYITSFERISNGGAEGGAIGKLPMKERFRWLTSTRSTVLQTSKVHPGLCVDAGKTLDKLFRQLVNVITDPHV